MLCGRKPSSHPQLPHLLPILSLTPPPSPPLLQHAGITIVTPTYAAPALVASTSALVDVASQVERIVAQAHDALHRLENVVAVLELGASSRDAVRQSHSVIVTSNALLVMARSGLATIGNSEHVSASLRARYDDAALAVKAGIEAWKGAATLYNARCAALRVRLG